MSWYVGIIRYTGQAEVTNTNPEKSKNRYLFAFGPYSIENARSWALVWNQR